MLPLRKKGTLFYVTITQHDTFPCYVPITQNLRNKLGRMLRDTLGRTLRNRLGRMLCNKLGCTLRNKLGRTLHNKFH